MFWKRKKEMKVAKPPCIHEWTIVDVSESHFNAGVEVLVEDVFIIQCGKCRTEKRIDEYRLYKMRRLGLIKGNSE